MSHTYSLKTIARRFLRNNPPYMGTRYAAANDLSVAINSHMQQPQFLPFIPYRLQFGRSGMMLDVKFAVAERGNILWQYTSNGTVAQDFSFEDAGDGFVYIRSYISHLYVTVKPAHPTHIGGKIPAAIAFPLKPEIIQDIKYESGNLTTVGAPQPGLQKWKLVRASDLATESNLFVISNQAYPNWVLQPISLTESESPVTLMRAGGGIGIHTGSPSVWKVSSPLLGDGTGVAE